MPNSRFALHGRRPSLIHGLCAIFASDSRLMRLFQAPLDTCLGSPFFCQPLSSRFVVTAITQNLVVKFDGEICGGVLVENASDDFPSKRSSKISFQTSPEVRHQFRRKLCQLHSGNRWCLGLHFTVYAPSIVIVSVRMVRRGMFNTAGSFG